ncbi:MAG: hypothetical protein L0346_22130 [Chloroflexi bacterium]|nr:hypothetical protein [Chloroflexota bacterium]
MPARLDWHIEEEISREAGQPAAVPAGRWRWWLAGLAGLLFLALVGGLLARLAGRQVTVATTTAEREVRAAHALVQEMVSRGDEELLATLLATDEEWAAGQQALLAGDAFLARRGLGLSLAATVPRVVEVTLAPDLRAATVVFEQEYRPAGEPPSPLVTLQHTAHYRRNGQRWLLAPPGGDFWGAWQTSHGRLLTLIYPARDEALALRLAADLERALEKLCTGLSATMCPRTLQATIRLETTLASLLALDDPRTVLLGGRNLALPTPTLAGRPVDEAGYQALLHGYVTQMAGGFLAERYGIACCEQLLYSQARLAGHLQYLGFRPWFPILTQERLPEPAAALPEQDLALLCQATLEQPAQLLRYRPAANVWLRETHLAGRFAGMRPLPGGQGLALYDQPAPAGQVRPGTMIWRPDQALLALSALRFAGADPAGRRLLLLAYEGQWQTGGELLRDYSLVDLSGCRPDGCPAQAIAGPASWSPDGAQTLVEVSGTVWLGDGLGSLIAPLGQGAGPFWLDEHSYGYLRPAGRPTEVVMAAPGDEGGTLLTAADLLAAAPEADPAAGLVLRQVAASPTHPDQLFILAAAFEPRLLVTSRQVTFLFAYDRRTSEIEQRWQLAGGKGYGTLAFDPGGRWLVLAAFDRTETRRFLYLYDVVDGRLETVRPLAAGLFPSYDWSADGEWLAVMDGGLLNLQAPTAGASHYLIPAGAGCKFVAWIE